MAFYVGDEHVLRVPMDAKPERSASGKTLVVATTHGNKETDCVVNGKKVDAGWPEHEWHHVAFSTGCSPCASRSYRPSAS